MAANLLLEEDVPGAKFVHASVEEHTNIQLKRWLKCRGLPTSGKRPDLIERYPKSDYVLCKQHKSWLSRMKQ